ncbi:MAG: hypothetical protein ABR863_11970 [Roseiarcus sp.]|jgi:hypothetical protein
MPGFFSILIDKSVLQGLTAREAKWLLHHLRVNLPPVFFSEVLGDLKKEKGFSTASGEGDVKMMSGKVDSAFVFLNKDSQMLLRDELLGKRFEMDGRPVLDTEEVRMADGTRGAFFDQTPMQRVLARWKEGNFEAMEHEFAQVWRSRLASIDLEKIVRLNSSVRNKEVRTPADVRRLVDNALFRPDRNFANLSYWLEIIKAPETVKRGVLETWKRVGRPPAIKFAPYIAHIAKVRYFFYIAVAHQVITTRSSNQIDMEYFDYLPFARVFSSNDNLHTQVYPALAEDWQIFIPFAELKTALRELAEYYDAMAPEQKRLGSMTYADYPPIEMDNAITRAYDRFMPKWRIGANEPPPPRDPVADARLMEHLRSIENAIDAHKAKRS